MKTKNFGLDGPKTPYGNRSARVARAKLAYADLCAEARREAELQRFWHSGSFYGSFSPTPKVVSNSTFLRDFHVCRNSSVPNPGSSVDPLKPDEAQLKAASIKTPSLSVQLTVDATSAASSHTYNAQKILAQLPPSVLGVASTLAELYEVPTRGDATITPLTMASINTAKSKLQSALNIVGITDLDKTPDLEKVIQSDTQVDTSSSLSTMKQKAVDFKYETIRTVKVGNIVFNYAQYRERLKAEPWVGTNVSPNLFDTESLPVPSALVLNALGESAPNEIIAGGGDTAHRVCQFIVGAVFSRFSGAVPVPVLQNFESSSTVFVPIVAAWFPTFFSGDNDASKYIRGLLTSIRVQAQGADKFAFCQTEQEKRALIFCSRLSNKVSVAVSNRITRDRLTVSAAELRAVRKLGDDAIKSVKTQFPLFRIASLTYQQLPLSAQTTINDALGSENNPSVRARAKALALRTWQTLEYMAFITAQGNQPQGFNMESYILLCEKE